jgi:hypothetical protein
MAWVKRGGAASGLITSIFKANGNKPLTNNQLWEAVVATGEDATSVIKSKHHMKRGVLPHMKTSRKVTSDPQQPAPRLTRPLFCQLNKVFGIEKETKAGIRMTGGWKMSAHPRWAEQQGLEPNYVHPEHVPRQKRPEPRPRNYAGVQPLKIKYEPKRASKTGFGNPAGLQQ